MAFEDGLGVVPGVALLLVAVTMLAALAVTVRVGASRIAERDAAVSRRPLSVAVAGLVVVMTGVCVLANGARYGRFEPVVAASVSVALAAGAVIGSVGCASALGRLAVRALGRRLPPGRRSVALGAAVVAVACVLPLVGAVAAFAVLVLCCGAAVPERLRI